MWWAPPRILDAVNHLDHGGHGGHGGHPSLKQFAEDLSLLSLVRFVEVIVPAGAGTNAIFQAAGFLP